MSTVFKTQVDIAAPPEKVFAYFIEAEKMVRWMGDFARLQAVEGGEFTVDINGVLIRGHYVSLVPFSRLEITWGELGNLAMLPGSTRVVIELAPSATGTSLTLSQFGLSAEEEVKHAMGWPHYMGRLAELAERRDPGVDPFAPVI